MIYHAEHLAEHRWGPNVKCASVAAENAARDAYDKALHDGTLKPVVDDHPRLTELIRELTPDPLVLV